MAEEDAKENFERLKAIRAAHRGVITKKVQQAIEVLGDEGDTLTDEDFQQLDVIKRLVDGKLKKLEEIDQNVLSLCTLETIEGEIEGSDKVSAKVVECQKKIQDVVQKHNERMNSLNTTVSSSPQQLFNQGMYSHDPFGASSPSANQVKAKLPKLTLPKFWGDLTNWMSFWDSFESAVHKNPSISKVDKFNYLNLLLEGTARRAVQGLTLTEANYDSAVEILRKRYGRPQQIISAHMDEVIKLQPGHNDRPASLRYLYDRISVHVRGLASLGISTEQYGSLLIPVVMSKLPNEIRLEVARNSTNEIWKFLQMIKKEVEARETSEHVKTSKSSRKPPLGKPPIPSANKFGRNPVKCVYCKEYHYSASCERVKDPNKHKEILVKERRCLNCLRPGHVVRVCKNTKVCRHCGESHHQSICPSVSSSSSDERPTTSPPEQEVSNTTTTNTIGNKGTVLLQTAKAIAFDEDNSKSTYVRILFDNGSQRSYVTSSLKSRLNLKPIKTETLHLNMFGGSTFRKQSCEVVKLRLRKNEGKEVEVTALNYPIICSPLPSKVEVNYPHLEDLQLADSLNDKCGAIDVLIGSDYYWEIVSGKTVHGDCGPTAVSSKFGWLLSGPLRDSMTSDTVTSNLIISGDWPFASRENAELISSISLAISKWLCSFPL
ncbi:uncharacterized protein [Montipora capricornis]|uniref:uncharacterized protein n=1 Tax=Montipora capricornis TaxID=246305 RepID=UPI0035F17F9C